MTDWKDPIREDADSPFEVINALIRHILPPLLYIATGMALAVTLILAGMRP
jgi:IS4 transposase